MSKQKKEKQPPVLGRLLEYAGGHKWLSVLGCGLSGVSAAAGIFPFVFVWYAARGSFNAGRRRSGRACPLRLVCAGGGASERSDLFRRPHVYAPCGLPGGDEYAKGGGRPSH